MLQSFPRLLGASPLGVLLLGPLAFASAQADLPEEKLHGDLGAVLSAADADALVPVTIVLVEQAPQASLEAARAIVDKAARRAVVVSTLRQVADASQAPLVALLAEAEAAGRAQGVRTLWLANVVAARVQPALALELAALPEVAYVHHDAPRGVEVLSSAPAPVPSPMAGGTPTCGLNLIGAPDVWSDYGIDGAGVVVGVIDTGLCITHPDIANNVWRNPCEIQGNNQDDDGNGFVDDLYGWNFEGDNANISDTNSHGSHVAGTVAGDGSNGTQCGVAPGADIMVLKFFNSLSGEMSVWQSMQYGVANGADVLTASLGWNHSWGPDRATWRMISENTISTGMVVTFAAHNFGCGNAPDDVSTPGDVPDMLTVGAVDCGDTKAGFSSCGPTTWQNVAPYNDHPYPPGLIKPTIAGPGVGTISHNICSGYSSKDGTSMATPHVAGTVALLLQADPSLDQFGVIDLLTSTAIDLGPNGNDNQTGHGRIDAHAAVTAALANGNFCEAKLNSCGGTPTISATGTPSASATSGYTITGSDARGGNQIGILAYTDAGLALPPTPFDGGSLCIQAPILRGPTVVSGGTTGQCDGTYTVDWNAWASGNLGGNPAAFLSVPGTEVTCQWWGRDTASNGIYLTEAMAYTVCP